MRRRTLVLAAPALLVVPIAAQEEPVKLVATIAVQGAFTEIEPLLRARSAMPVHIEFATTAALIERLKRRRRSLTRYGA